MIKKLSSAICREWLNLMLGAMLGALFVNCFYGPLGPRDLLALRLHRAQLVNARDHLLAENTQMKERVVKLRSDDAYLQWLIRQELGYARADEFVYRFPESKDSANP
jgi:cell division protein FtsB